MVEAKETGKDRVKKICDVLRKETLEPALSEAKGIVEDARAKASQIQEDAQKKAAKMIADAEKEIEKKQTIFKASLNQSARQSIEWLKQEIEERLLNQNLLKLIDQSTTSPKVIAEMVTSLVKAVQAEGLKTDLSAVIPSSVDVKAVNELLGKELLEELKEKSVLVGEHQGGIELKLGQEKITMDVTDKALLELMTRYIRKDFEKFFYGTA